MDQRACFVHCLFQSKNNYEHKQTMKYPTMNIVSTLLLLVLAASLWLPASAFLPRRHVSSAPTLTRLWGRRGGGGDKKKKAVAKQDLPSKVCVVCGRPFAWRKKWERCVSCLFVRWRSLVAPLIDCMANKILLVPVGRGHVLFESL